MTNSSSKEAKAIVGSPYVSNSYQGVILPSTVNGLKLYLAATKPLKESKRISHHTKNCLESKTLLKQTGRTFGWGQAISIPTA